MFTPNTLSDDLPDAPSEGNVRVPLEKSLALEKMLLEFGALHSAIMHNSPVNGEQIRIMSQHLGNQRVVLGNKSYSLNELRTVPDIKRAFEIWNEGLLTPTELEDIMEEWKEARVKGYCINRNKLLYLNDECVEQLIKRWHVTDDYLDLNVLSLTDKQASMLGTLWKCGNVRFNNLRILTGKQVIELLKIPAHDYQFNGMKNMTDAVADAIAICGRRVGFEFNGLETLSENQVISFSKAKLSSLELKGLRELSAKQACALARSSAGYLHLDGLENMSDKTLDGLAPFEGRIYLNFSQPPTKTQIAIIATFKGEAFLGGLGNLSDQDAEILSTFNGKLLSFDSSDISFKARTYLLRLGDKIMGLRR